MVSGKRRPEPRKTFFPVENPKRQEVINVDRNHETHWNFNLNTNQEDFKMTTTKLEETFIMMNALNVAASMTVIKKQIENFEDALQFFDNVSSPIKTVYNEMVKEYPELMLHVKEGYKKKGSKLENVFASYKQLIKFYGVLYLGLSNSASELLYQRLRKSEAFSGEDYSMVSGW